MPENSISIEPPPPASVNTGKAITIKSVMQLNEVQGSLDKPFASSSISNDNKIAKPNDDSFFDASAKAPEASESNLEKSIQFSFEYLGSVY